MTNTEEATKLLLERVRTNEHTPFQFIHSIDEYFAALTCKKALLEVARSFKKTAANVYKNYLQAINSNTDRLDLLISYKQIKNCAKFYFDDAKIVKDMLSEYRCYLRNGHIINNIILNNYRPEEECIDYRKLPISWW